LPTAVITISLLPIVSGVVLNIKVLECWPLVKTAVTGVKGSGEFARELGLAVIKFLFIS
jgi:hypothetical protein